MDFGGISFGGTKCFGGDAGVVHAAVGALVQQFDVDVFGRRLFFLGAAAAAAAGLWGEEEGGVGTVGGWWWLLRGGRRQSIILFWAGCVLLNGNIALSSYGVFDLLFKMFVVGVAVDEVVVI